jgi:endonuclease/exonuclease/phosphatase (EEP) superfamily protein YafD
MGLNDKNMPQKSRKNLIIFFLLLGIIGTTLVSLSRYINGIRILELFSHFQFQYLIINVLLFGLLLLTRKKYFIITGLLCVMIILFAIIPWYIPRVEAGSTPNSQVNIFLINVNQRNKSYSKVISYVREVNPDIAVFDEIDDAWIEHLNSLREILPYSVENVNPAQLGITIYSKQPLKNVQVDWFSTVDSPTILSNFDINGQAVHLIAAHPLPPFKSNYFHSRNKQLEEISEYVQQLKTPVVMVGDLNITMWSPYYKRFVSQTGLINARQGFGILPSWPAKSSVKTSSSLSRIPTPLKPLLSIPIDHCLISPEIQVLNIKIGSNVDSDHLPVITDITIANSTQS